MCDAEVVSEQSRQSETAADTNDLAIASMFLSIIWIFGIGSVLGIAFSIRSLREIRESDGQQGGRILALAGFWIGIIGLGSLALVIYFGLYSARDGG